MPRHRIIITETTESAYLVDALDETAALREALEDHMHLRNTRVWFHIADRVVEVDGSTPNLDGGAHHGG